MLQLHNAMYNLINGLTQLLAPHTQLPSTADNLFLSPEVSKIFLSVMSEKQLPERPAPIHMKEEDDVTTPPTPPIITRSESTEKMDTSSTSSSPAPHGVCHRGTLTL